MSEEIRDIDERLRDVEIKGSATNESMNNLTSGILEIKQMMTKIMVDYNKVAELSARLSSVERLELKMDDFQRKYDILNSAFIAVKSEHSSCKFNRGKQEDFMDNLDTRLTKIENAVSILAESKNKVEGTLWRWIDKIGWILIIAVLLTTLTHVNGTKIAEPFGIQHPAQQQQQQQPKQAQPEQQIQMLLP